jgi:hypothetical protein
LSGENAVNCSNVDVGLGVGVSIRGSWQAGEYTAVGSHAGDASEDVLSVVHALIANICLRFALLPAFPTVSNRDYPFVFSSSVPVESFRILIVHIDDDCEK